MKKVLILLIVSITILFSFSIIKITNEPNNFINKFKIINNNDSDVIGNIKINSLNINEDLYKLESEDNNVDKHITILKESIFPDEDNSIIFIAAHSGTGSIAYFKDLDKLKKGDTIVLTIKNKKYLYVVKESWEEPKNGYINVNKDVENQLILTTCSPNNYKKQLIVNCIEKESY